MVKKDTQFVMKNNQVQQPVIPQDGLELYYDVKGKKNTDNYKGTLLDMSGNGRHGTLSNFAYEGVSGFTGTTEGGLLLDDVDDKIVRPAVSGIEYTSASRNLLNLNVVSFTAVGVAVSNTSTTIYIKGTSTGSLSALHPTFTTNWKIKLAKGTYTISPTSSTTTNLGVMVGVFNGTALLNQSPVNGYTSFTCEDGEYTVGVYVPSGAVLGSYILNLQIEKGTVATPYTRYTPLPIMTYQMNGNILSFEKDGTVKRTTKDVNGNEVVVSRKGINLVRNGNFHNRSNGWQGAGASFTSFSENSAELTVIGGGTKWVQPLSDTQLFAVNGHKVYASLYTTTTNTESSTNLMINAGSTQTLTSLSRVNSLPGWNKLEGIATLSGQIGAREIKIYNGHTFSTAEISVGQKFLIKNVQLIDLTDAYGAGNEPDLAYIQVHPEEFEWTPNPNDLIETVEIKNNLVGDLENLQGSRLLINSLKIYSRNLTDSEMIQNYKVEKKRFGM